MFLQSAEIQSLINLLKIITVLAVTITIEVDLVLFTGGDAWKIETLPVDWCNELKWVTMGHNESVQCLEFKRR